MSQELQIAIIASSATILGVVISQAISIGLSIFDKKNKKHVLLRQKYEEMMFEFHDSLKYIQDVQTCETLEQLFEHSRSPQSGKSLGLALLYFPDLVEPLENYSHSQVSFYQSIISSFNPSIPHNAGAQAVVEGSYLAPMKELNNCKQVVMDALVLNAKKYTKA